MCFIKYITLLLFVVIWCRQTLGKQNCHPQKKVYIVHLSFEQQVKKLSEARNKCLDEIATEPLPTQAIFCNKTFSNGMCLPYTEAGSEALIPCPDYVHGFDTRGIARSYCQADGSWLASERRNGSATDFTDCLSYSSDEANLDHVSSTIKEHVHIIKILYHIGYAVSVASLGLAVLLMLVFRRLHCQRNTIHINLFISFCLRAIICILKDINLVPQGDAIIVNNVLAINSSGSTWHCKVVQTMFHYLLTANYMWIFVEAFYLHTLIFFAMSSKKKKLFKFYIIFGWVSPLPSVVAWVIVRLNYADSLCWSTEQGGYHWITRGPIVLSIVVNFLLFLNIIRVVFTKLSEPARCDPNRHRKLARSTLVLIPLFGVYYILFIAIPDCIDDITHVVLLYIEILFSSFQGFVVALLFCFLNTEDFTSTQQLRSYVDELRKKKKPDKENERNKVKSEIKRAWQGHFTRRRSFMSSKTNRSLTIMRDNGAIKANGNGRKLVYHGLQKEEDVQEMYTLTEQQESPNDEQLQNFFEDNKNDLTLKVNGQVRTSSAMCEQEEERSQLM